MKEFFEPSSIAVVGATPRVPKPGYVITANLKRSFKGKVYAVNPKYSKVLGLPCYPSLRDVPDDVDLAVIAVPTRAVEGVIDDAVSKGVKAVIVITAGFSEIGNKELERRIASKLRESGIRLIGPNCLGVYYEPTGVDTFFFREPGTRRPGFSKLALISQSGALAASLMDWASVKGIGIGAAVSLGNKADVNEVDVMKYLSEKGFEKFLLYIEGLRPGEGEEFLGALAELSSRGARIGVYKGGRTKASQRATSSHTASVAGDYKVFKELVWEYGAIPLESFTEVKAFLSAFQYSPPLRGRKALVVTDAGGIGVMIADSLQFDMPKPFDSELERKLPPYVKLNNPMDVGGDADDERYRLVLERLAPKYDLVIVVALMESPSTSLYLADIVKESAEETGKPHLLLSFGGNSSKALEERARELEIPFVEGVDEAIAFSNLLLKEMTARELLEVRLGCC